MRILYLNYSGSTIQLMRVGDIANGLRKQGHEVILKHMHWGVARQIQRAEKQKADAYATTKAPPSAKPAKTIPAPEPPPRWLRILKGEIRRSIANHRYMLLEYYYFLKYRPDFVLVRPGPIWSIFITATVLGQKMIWDTDGPMSENFQYAWNDLPRYYLKFEPFFVKRVKALTVISSAMKDYYQEINKNPDKIFIMPNGVDSGLFRYGIDPAPAIERYNLKDKTVIGFMGNLAPWHGLPGLLKEFPALAEKYENVRLLLVGIDIDWDNPPDGVPDKILAYKDKVLCTGRIPFNEVPIHLKAIDICVLPYPHIDFFYFSPMKLFESMAVGCGVVAADIGQVGEVIREGENGLKFKAGDYGEMRHQIEKLIGNPDLGKQMGKTAAGEVREKYVWEKTTRAIIDAYEYAFDSKKK
ncbi:MAG: glycosyltransferase [candidate division Zixibacteria bacterium]|nr:glycosyltransferase [candidate division Zixibacteria bacterium]